MSLSPIEKAASGALASVLASSLVYPLDLSKTIIQTQVKTQKKAQGSQSQDFREAGSEKELKYKNTIDVLTKIYKKRGLLGWYHGLFSSIFGTAAQNFSYFYWYTLVRRSYNRIYKHIPHHKPSTFMELLLGALAAAISQLFTMPIGVITTQQQTDKTSQSLYSIAKQILEQDGIHGFWRGLRVSLVLCVNPSITYGSYERLKQILYSNKKFLSPLESFSIGMLAKSIATLATQPLIVSKAMVQKKTTRKKSANDSASDQSFNVVPSEEQEEIAFDSFTHALQHLWETEKVRGLYKGIAPQLLKGVFVQGLLFMFKDQLDHLFILLLKLIKSKNPVRI